MKLMSIQLYDDFQVIALKMNLQHESAPQEPKRSVLFSVQTYVSYQNRTSTFNLCFHDLKILLLFRTTWNTLLQLGHFLSTHTVSQPVIISIN